MTRRLLPWLPLLVAAVLFLVVFSGGESGRELTYGQLKRVLAAPGVEFRDVVVGTGSVKGTARTSDLVSGLDGEETPFGKVENGRLQSETKWTADRVGLRDDPEFVALLDAHVGSEYDGQREASALSGVVTYVVTYVLILTVMLALSLFAFRLLMGGGGGALGFGRSRHKVYAEAGGRATFEDVAGIDEAKEELTEVVDFLKNPEKYQQLGGRIPKGVLLVGPPGTGKTLLARAVAGEAGVPFFSMSGSDFVEMFVGVGASRVRDLFKDAAARAPCIIFIDELDALGRSRNGNGFGSHEEREQTLNQLLVEMDGFDANRGVIIMAATNRPEVLDQALLRPGRFDRTVVVDRPDVVGREKILAVHAKTVKLADDVNLRQVAALTPGSVGADLANLVNEAALLAARRGLSAVTTEDFDEAIERTSIGLLRKSRIMQPDEKRRVAVHEAGHALVACAVAYTGQVHKVSIIPRGVAGGYVLSRPEGDRMLVTRSELEGNIKVALGGTVAEELTFGEVSDGATSDLMKANGVARRMVTKFGMSRLGRIFLSDPEGVPLAGGEAGPSEQTAREIDLEVRDIIDRCLAEVKSLLEAHRATMGRVAADLIEKEVIEGRDLLQILDGDGYPLSESARRSLKEAPASTAATAVEAPELPND